jgi:HicB family
MDLGLYVENVHRQLATAAAAGGDDARALAERLAAPLDMTVRLTLQDALSAAAEEITTELAPGSVELRLRGRDIEFAVTPPPAEPSADDLDDAGPVWAGATGGAPAAAAGWQALAPVGTSAAGTSGDGGEASMTRINLRLPDQLKAQIEGAAAGEGLSVNAWLVRAAAAALDRSGTERRSDRRAPRGSQHYTGWAR